MTAPFRLAAPARRLRVLVVDDEASIRRVLVWALRGCETCTAEDVDEAEALLAQREVDVVVCDNTMPGRSGTELLGLVAARYPRVRRIMYSGTPPDEMARLVCEGVIEHFVSKPGHREVAALCRALVDADDGETTEAG